LHDVCLSRKTKEDELKVGHNIALCEYLASDQKDPKAFLDALGSMFCVVIVLLSFNSLFLSRSSHSQTSTEEGTNKERRGRHTT
jgi:hypothetical protein